MNIILCLLCFHHCPCRFKYDLYLFVIMEIGVLILLPNKKERRKSRWSKFNAADVYREDLSNRLQWGLFLINILTMYVLLFYNTIATLPVLHAYTNIKLFVMMMSFPELLLNQ